MTTPSMKGFSTQVPYSGNEFLDSDGAAFRLPVVEPGGSVTNYSAWWYNFGYSFLYNGQLSLVVGGTMDSGADADTIDVMNIGAPYGANWLNHATPATAANTTTWTYPMQDPFRPFIDKFAGGVKWNPPIGAATGIIRKCFQWDGSYYPDTWDYIWYPMGNGYFPDNSFYDNPLETTISLCTETVVADVNAETGYSLDAVPDFGVSASIEYKHSLSGTPWVTSADNAVGYCVSVSMRTTAATTESWFIHVDDGTWEFDVDISSTVIRAALGLVVPVTYTTSFSAVTFKEIIIAVKGTDIEVFVDSVSRLTGTLNLASSSKRLMLHNFAHSSSLWGVWIDHIKYFLNGNTPPVY